MRKFLIQAALLLTGGLMAQQPTCYTTEMQNEWFNSHPEMRAVFDRQQEEAAALDRELFKTGYKSPVQMMGKSSSAVSFTIPIVFHILHTGGVENISDAQVQDAVAILTRDFNKQNQDTVDVVGAFKNNIGNPEVSFVLATKDPNGQCTNGIIRHYDSKTDWNSSFSNYKYTWPPNKYLNIYVVRKIGSGAAGYTYLPGSGIPSSADAIVILSSYVGSIGSGNPGTSRALTHEVGHWLNLPHTWGGTNQPGVACGDEGVSDTPVTKGFTSCNLNNAAICSPGVVENMQNYMDYAYCQRMFTTGQSVRMQIALGSNISNRNNLSTPANLLATGVSNPMVGCSPMLQIGVTGNFTVCAGKALTLNSYTSNAHPTSYSWSADNGAQIQNTGAASTNITFLNQGVTTVTCVVANGNGNATASLQVTVKSPFPDIVSMHSESFEDNAPQLPADWALFGSTALDWQNNIIGASHGLNSMYVRGELMPAGAWAVMETPSFDFQNNPGARFSFKYAYRKETSTTKDIFILQASNDCGGTWVDVYSPSAIQLAQNSGGTSTQPLQPELHEWKLYDQVTNHPMFTNFLNEPNVRFRFYFKADPDGNGYGNRMFVDEINFDTPVGTNELTREAAFNVYPNPSADAINITFVLRDRGTVSYKVLSVTGAEVLGSAPMELGSGDHILTFNEGKQLTPGIYFVNFSLDGATMSRKLVVQ